MLGSRRAQSRDPIGSGGVMKSVIPAIAAIAVVAVCGQASAQSSTDIVQRLEALEQSNTELRKENTALRDRVRRIESARQVSAVTGTHPTATSAKPGSGYAALGATSPVYKAPPAGMPAPWSWTGFYVGGHGGYAWGRATGPDVHIDERGGFGGIQMGVNYQFWGPWVLGFEQDVSFADIKGNFDVGGGKNNGGSQPVDDGGQTQGTGVIKFEAFGTFRARVGPSLGPLLLYGTAGVAWALAKPTITITSPNPEVLHDSRVMSGLAAGGGIEIAALPNVTFKAEYLYLDFPDKNFFAGTDQAGAADARFHTVRAGVNWLFH